MAQFTYQGPGIKVRYFTLGFIVLSNFLYGQDTVYHQRILDSALTISDKGEAIRLLKENAFLLPEDQQYFLGLYDLRIGRIYGNQHQLDIGENYYRSALKIGQRLKNSMLIGKGYLGIGGVQLIKQLETPENASYDSILYYFNLALPYLKEEKDLENIEGLYTNIALISVNTGQISSAKKSLEQGLKSRLNREDTVGIIASLNNIGLLYRKSKNLETAVKYYNQSYNLASAKSMLNEMSSTKLGLARMYLENKDYSKALSHYLAYDSLNTLSLNAEFQKQIADAETKYETAEKQAELERNKRRIILLTIVIFSILIISIIGYLFIRQRRRMTKVAAEKAITDLLQKQEMKATNALLEGQDKERKRIAAELHDNLGSILVTLNMYADTLQNKKPDEIPPLAKKISEVAQLANEETRKISHSLDSGLLKHFGLETAIRQLAEAVSTARNIQFEHSLQIEKISSDAGLEIYRIIQELVNNTLKHSQCTRVHLELSQVGPSLSIIYEDNGVGFNKSEITQGMGLNNIENRVKKLDGELTIDSSPGKGSTFIIEIAQL